MSSIDHLLWLDVYDFSCKCFGHIQCSMLSILNAWKDKMNKKKRESKTNYECIRMDHTRKPTTIQRTWTFITTFTTKCNRLIVSEISTALRSWFYIFRFANHFTLTYIICLHNYFYCSFHFRSSLFARYSYAYWIGCWFEFACTYFSYNFINVNISIRFTVI